MKPHLLLQCFHFLHLLVVPLFAVKPSSSSLRLEPMARIPGSTIQDQEVVVLQKVDPPVALTCLWCNAAATPECRSQTPGGRDLLLLHHGGPGPALLQVLFERLQ